MRTWLLILITALGLRAQEVRIQVLGTTDLHGHVMAEDTFTRKPANLGWAKVATLLRQQQARNPNTLLVDCGDTLQGEPVNYLRQVLQPDLPEPSLAIMNALGYAAMAVGNHDFDFGPGALRDARLQARFPLLSANTVAEPPAQGFASHTIVTVAGLRVALVGFTTPRVPAMTEPENFRGLAFRDIVATAAELVPRLRAAERADLVVVLMHSGLGALPGAPGDEDEALRLADQVPGIDAIFAGHTHRAVQTTHRGVPILQAGCFGQRVARLELSLRRDGDRWRVVSHEAGLLAPEDSTPADPEVLALTAPLRAEVDRYLDTAATNLLVDLDSRWSRMEDTPLMQLLHRAQLQATGAQLSAVGCPGPALFIPKGPTSVRQFYALAPYEHRVAVIKVTGDQVRRYLEHAARHYNRSWEPELYNREVPFYQYDTLEGVGYALDLGKPVGSRVTGLTFQGRPVQSDQVFTLALSTYRLRGGGGYLEAIGFQGQPERITPASQRNLLLGFVLGQPSLNLAVPHAWRTIPYLDRERVLNAAR